MKNTEISTKKINIKRIAEYITAYAIMGGILYIWFQFIWILSPIPSGSMETTVMTGDVVLGTRYNADEINRYDIMIFDAPDNPGTYYIKRVIGLPGEIIVVKNGKVYADGVELDDSFVNTMDSTEGDGTYEVPEGCYFMMGDNRDASLDSRFWDDSFVPADKFYAKAWLDLSSTGIHLLKYTDVEE